MSSPSANPNSEGRNNRIYPETGDLNERPKRKYIGYGSLSPSAKRRRNFSHGSPPGSHPPLDEPVPAYTDLVDPVSCSPCIVQDEMCFLEPNLPDSRVLQLGCRKGTLTLAICEKATHVTGIDSDPMNTFVARVAAGQRGIKNVNFFHVHDMMSLPFGDKSFDIVYASNLMAHLPSRGNQTVVQRVLSEMQRVAKPGGVIATRDISAHDFYPTHDLVNLINRTMFRACGLQGWYGHVMPRLYKNIGLDLNTNNVIVNTTSSVWGPAVGEHNWYSRYAEKLGEHSVAREQWVKAGVSEAVIDLIIKRLELWGGSGTALYTCLFVEIIARKDCDDMTPETDSDTDIELPGLQTDSGQSPHAVV